MVKIVKDTNEMDAVVQKYCGVVAESTNELCEGCRIKNLCEPIDGYFEDNPDVLEVAYREVVQADDGMGCENCLYFNREVNDYPCTECKFNKYRSDPAYETTPLFWTDIKFEASAPTEQNEEVTNEVTNEVATNAVNHPSHYNQSGMECIDEMVLIFGREATKHFCLLNAWKYRARAMYKNGQEDMDKANWYIAKYKELTLNE